MLTHRSCSGHRLLIAAEDPAARLTLRSRCWWHHDRVPVYRDSAVVLRVTKLGEADRIVTLLTRREGRVRAVAKGVRRTKSKFGGRLEPFSHVDLQLFAGRNLDIVTQAETLDQFGSVLAADYSRYTCATAIVETAERLTAEEREPSLKLYLLVVSALRAMSETPRDPSLVLDAFLLRAMALAGWAPALTECARCGTPGPHAAFHIPSGGLLCARVPWSRVGRHRPAGPDDGHPDGRAGRGGVGRRRRRGDHRRVGRPAGWWRRCCSGTWNVVCGRWAWWTGADRRAVIDTPSGCDALHRPRRAPKWRMDLRANPRDRLLFS